MKKCLIILAFFLLTASLLYSDNTKIIAELNANKGRLIVLPITGGREIAGIIIAANAQEVILETARGPIAIPFHLIDWNQGQTSDQRAANRKAGIQEDTSAKLFKSLRLGSLAGFVIRYSPYHKQLHQFMKSGVPTFRNELDLSNLNRLGFWSSFTFPISPQYHILTSFVIDQGHINQGNESISMLNYKFESWMLQRLFTYNFLKSNNWFSTGLVFHIFNSRWVFSNLTDTSHTINTEFYGIGPGIQVPFVISKISTLSFRTGLTFNYGNLTIDLDNRDQVYLAGIFEVEISFRPYFITVLNRFEIAFALRYQVDKIIKGESLVSLSDEIINVGGTGDGLGILVKASYGF